LRIACVLVEHFPFKLEAGRDPLLAKHRAIVFQRSGSHRTVLDVSPGVKGVVSGMSLQEAQTRVKDVVLVEADMPAYQRVFDRILLRLANWSPVIEAADQGCVYVGLQGLEDTYGSEARLINALLQAVPSYLEPRLGIGQGKFPAYLAAVRSQPGRAYKPIMESKEFLSPFPVDVLPVSWEVKKRLHSFGLHTLGEVASLPLGPALAQFGNVGGIVWRLAQGIDDSPLFPLRPKEEICASVSFPVPTANLGSLLMALETLLSRLFARPDMRGRFTRTALLEAQVLNRPSWQRRFVFKPPAGDKARAYFVMKGPLDYLSLPGPLEEVRLILKDLTGEVGRQESLFQEIRRTHQLREAITQLEVAQGCNPIYQIREVEPWSRIPERQQALVPYKP
jgi:DNA polymerase-4